MKFPNHILLDWNSSNSNIQSQHWFAKYFITEKYSSSHIFFFNFVLKKKILIKEKTLKLNFFLKNQKKYTLTYSKNNPIFLLKNSKITFYKNFFKNNPKSNHTHLTYKNEDRRAFDYLTKEKKNFNSFSILKTLKIVLHKKNHSILMNPVLWNFFDINFLKKDKIYTKLKYSRVPQYDIVSGGSAALFAGFLGFLICEKFGFELLDSGDFYTLFMYLVFFSFFLKLFLKLLSKEDYSWSAISARWFVFFYKNIFYLFLNRVRYLLKKIRF